MSNGTCQVSNQYVMPSFASWLVWLQVAAQIFIYASAQTPIDHPDDVAALGQLFNQTSGLSWTNNSGWIDWMNRSHVYSVCNAYGVVCNSTNGQPSRVIALNLANNGLNGIVLYLSARSHLFCSN
jgi:hypothetical protein